MEGIGTVAPVRPMMVPLAEMLRPQINAGDKISLPVANYTPMASFRYVQGVPAGADGGFPLSKLQILDTIIGNLVGLQDKSAVARLPADAAFLGSDQLDSLIHDFAGQLRAAAGSAKPGLPESIGASFGVAVSQTGTAINILA